MNIFIKHIKFCKTIILIVFFIFAKIHLLQISFLFDDVAGANKYEITLRSSVSIETINQTGTSFKSTNLFPGLLYHITIKVLNNDIGLNPFRKDFATGIFNFIMT